VETRIRSDIDGSSESELIDELGAEIVDFCSSGRPPSKSGAPLESRNIVMPQMDSDGWGRLDAVYEPLKELAVESGTMIGKFHPGCDDRAIRNSEFKVSISPVAMLAIRHMAPHDILFLNDSERWFREYDSRFSAHFEHNKVRDPFLLSLYSKARVSYGSSA
jgi:heptaprenyl diphosphate synthase